MTADTRAVAATAAAPRAVSYAKAARLWWRIGWLSFGGPTAQIALMHRLIVEERGWLSEAEYLSALGFCMLLPGPEAMQLATYTGWRLHGVRGGLTAGLLFVLPGALVVFAASAFYAGFAHLPLVLAAFRGIQATALVLVLEAMLRVGRRALKTPRDAWVAALAFAALFFFAVPFPAVIAAAALTGAAAGARREAHAARPADASPLPLAHMARTALLWACVWLVPLFAVAAAFGRAHILTQLAWFFSRLAVVTFGGAYAVLAYMSQDIVQHHGWLSATQMLDGLGLAETTPGPLILVTEFVAYLSGKQAGLAPAWLYATAGAAIALWATFTPCFLWVFTGAPVISRLEQWPRLRHALGGITAAVLGVIAQLTLWFAIHVWFTQVGAWRAGALQVPAPAWASLDFKAVALTLVSGVLLIRLHWGLHRVLFTMAALSLIWGLLMH